MPPTSLKWAWGWVVMMVMMTVPPYTLSTPTDITTPITPLQSAGDDGDDRCGDDARPVTSPLVDVTWERNSSQVAVHCPAKLNTFFTSLSEPSIPSPAESDVAKIGAGTRGVVVSLSHLVQEEAGVQVVVDVEECGCVDVAKGLPEWVEGLTFAIRGSLRLPGEWWVGSGKGVRDMWVRVNGGLSVGNVCEYLPPTLETLDLSYTPLGKLTLDGECAPPSLQRLEAIRSVLTHISLCTPSLSTLYVNNNEIDGDMNWVACEGGVQAVMYLHASHNHLTSASSCLWPSLATLELKENWLTTLDLTSCPPMNLTSLIASRNYLSDAPSPLPPALVFLDISHNNLTALPVLTRALQEADFSHNNIHRLGEGSFRRARKLHYLSLAHNHIKEIKERDFHGLKRLHRLDLSYNNVEFIAASSFLPFRHLRHLHLHHNHLTHLDARILHTLSVHTHATLHNNPWECNCQMLAALTQLQACADCKHKRVALQCKERNHLQDATALLHTCLHAIQHAQGKVDESDEDYSEEEVPEKTDGGAAGAVFLVPILVIIIILSVSVACGYKMYRKHRRAIVTTFTPFCSCCDRCGDSVNNNNHANSHHHHQEASQLPTGELQDSDTETEM